jgi:SAM-dependent methyltransferase
MSERLSDRLRALVDALPLAPGMNVLEIGCGPGAAAREVARRIGDGRVLAVDRSAAAVRQGQAGDDVGGRLSFRRAEAGTFALAPDEPRFDLAFAFRVGALDGRHPDAEEAARARIRAALKPGAPLFIDGGDPLREIKLDR